MERLRFEQVIVDLLITLTAESSDYSSLGAHAPLLCNNSKAEAYCQLLIAILIVFSQRPTGV